MLVLYLLMEMLLLKVLFFRDLRQIYLAAKVYEQALEPDKASISLREQAYRFYVRSLLRQDTAKFLTFTMYGACAGWLDVQLKKISNYDAANFNPTIMLKIAATKVIKALKDVGCLLYTSPSPRDA